MNRINKRWMMPSILTAMAVTGQAWASSEDAWATFRTDVRQACEARAKETGTDYDTMQVDDFGSESYGLALLKGADGAYMCIMDKKSKVAELAGPAAGTAPKDKPASDRPADKAPAAKPTETEATPAEAGTKAPETASSSAPTYIAPVDTDTDLTPTDMTPKKTPWWRWLFD